MEFSEISRRLTVPDDATPGLLLFSSPSPPLALSLASIHPPTPTDTIPSNAIEIVPGTGKFYFYTLFFPIFFLFIFILGCYIYYQVRRRRKQGDTDAEKSPVTEESDQDERVPVAQEVITVDIKNPVKENKRQSSAVKWRKMDLEELWYPPPGSPEYTPSGMAEARNIAKNIDGVVKMEDIMDKLEERMKT